MHPVSDATAVLAKASVPLVVLPSIAFAVVEGIATGGERFGSLVKYRVTGAMAEAFAVDAGELNHI